MSDTTLAPYLEGSVEWRRYNTASVVKRVIVQKLRAVLAQIKGQS